MELYSKILKISEDSVELNSEVKELLHKELCLGMTNYVVNNGTLADGCDNITDSQKYYTSIKMCYTLSSAMKTNKFLVMEAYADFLQAKEDQELAQKEHEKIRAEARLLRAISTMENLLVNVEDQKRQLDAFNKARLSLKDSVRAQYPEGIEQAEPDNWMAVARYKHLRKKMGKNEVLHHIPLPIDIKAKLGIELEEPEFMAWKIIADQKGMASLIEKHAKSISHKGELNG